MRWSWLTALVEYVSWMQLPAIRHPDGSAPPLEATRNPANEWAPHTSALTKLHPTPSVNLTKCSVERSAGDHVTLMPSKVQYDAPRIHSSPDTTGRSPGQAATRTGASAVPGVMAGD